MQDDNDADIAGAAQGVRQKVRVMYLTSKRGRYQAKVAACNAQHQVRPQHHDHNQHACSD
jgi:hypothetical protein